MIWAFLIGGQICDPWDYSDNPPPQLRVKNFELSKKIKLNFMKIFLKKSQKGHIWKTARFWAVLFGGKIRSSIGR